MPTTLVAVEAEPAHFSMMRQHLIDNDIDPSQHVLINAAVTATGTATAFVIGHSQEWYGQSIVSEDTSYGDWPEAKTVFVPSVTLSNIIQDLNVVDLIDMDIQGCEAEVIEASITSLNAKVRRLHIGTHSENVEERLNRCLSDARWRCLRTYPCQREFPTEFGDITFVDGVQSWVNPRLL